MSADVADIHSHLYPRWYVEALKARTEPPHIVGDHGDERFVIFPGEHGRPMGRDYWAVDAKLDFMQRFDVAQTVVSVGNPWLDPFEGAQAEELAAQANEYLAGLEGETGGRIVAVGVLPQHDLDAAVATARQIGATPSLYGIINGTRLCGRLFDDPSLEPLWAALEETALPLLVHPHYMVGGAELGGGHAFPLALGFPFETTLAMARLAFAGVLQRHPALPVIAAHGGGTIPFLAGRLDAGWRSDPLAREHLATPPSAELAKLYLDTLVYHPAPLLAEERLVGVDHMAFGTDHPFSVADPQANLDAIEAAFGEDDRRAVLSGTARALFGLRAPSEAGG